MLNLAEKTILDSIVVASENDPLKPEFPAENPKFPATPTYHIQVPGLSNVWLKDESQNPTGTHKDRMAWEIVVTYRDFLLAKERGQFYGPLPTVSLISSGSAAVAIQTQFKRYSLPNLKVLVDASIEPSTRTHLAELGCEVYFADLAKRALSSKDILQATRNENGFDITSNGALDPSTRFYDWLSYEIINQSPEYCFVPFGTGHLYENILQINKREVSSIHHDPRFSGNVATLRTCQFIGATTNYRLSLATKLYSPHLPFVHFDEQWIHLFRAAGYCGNKSGVYPLNEQCLVDALELAQNQNIQCEPSGIAGLAMLLQMKDSVSPTSKILIVNTGKIKYVQTRNVDNLLGTV